VSRNPEVRSRASASRSNALNFRTRRRSFKDVLSELRFSDVRSLQSDHDRRHRAKPSTRRRARDSEVGGDGHVPGALDELPKPMVVALLRAGRGRHANDHSPFHDAAQSLKDPRAVRRRDDNSSGRVQNVRGDSSVRSAGTEHSVVFLDAIEFLDIRGRAVTSGAFEGGY
jgi:hypothetical protein